MHGQRSTVELLPAVAKHFPERHASSQVDSLRGQKRVLLLVAVQGQLGQVSLGVAAEEIEDAVTSGICARRKCRPCHGRLGRPCCCNACEASQLFQPRQIGELVCFEQPRDNAGIQTIQTDDDDLLDGSSSSAFLT